MLEKYNITNSNIIGICIFLILILLGIGLGVSYPSGNIKSNVKLLNAINKIDNNYSIKVSYEDKSLRYETDGKVVLFNNDDKSNGYIIYNNKMYFLKLNENNYKLSEVEYKIDEFYPYYDLELIKKVLLTYCDFEIKDTNNAYCEVRSVDYLNEYNSKYGKGYHLEDKKVEFKIYYSTNISSITIDYSDIDNYINNSYARLNIKINIENLNSNNFDEIVKYLKL